MLVFYSVIRFRNTGNFKVKLLASDRYRKKEKWEESPLNQGKIAI